MTRLDPWEHLVGSWPAPRAPFIVEKETLPLVTAAPAFPPWFQTDPDSAVVLSSQKVEEASGQSFGPAPQAPWKVMGREPWDLLPAPGGGWMEGSLSMSIAKPKLMNEGDDWEMGISGRRGGQAGMAGQL